MKVFSGQTVLSVLDDVPPAMRQEGETWTSLRTALALTTQYSTPSAGRPRHSTYDRQHNSPDLFSRHSIISVPDCTGCVRLLPRHCFKPRHYVEAGDLLTVQYSGV
jgi:hypothetical protein